MPLAAGPGDTAILVPRQDVRKVLRMGKFVSRVLAHCSPHEAAGSTRHIVTLADGGHGTQTDSASEGKPSLQALVRPAGAFYCPLLPSDNGGRFML